MTMKSLKWYKLVVVAFVWMICLVPLFSHFISAQVPQFPIIPPHQSSDEYRIEALEKQVSAHLDKTEKERVDVRLSVIEDRLDLGGKLLLGIMLAILAQTTAYIFNLRLRSQMRREAMINEGFYCSYGTDKKCRKEEEEVSVDCRKHSLHAERGNDDSHENTD